LVEKYKCVKYLAEGSAAEADRCVRAVLTPLKED